MRLTLENPEHINLIRSYRDHEVTVNDQQYSQSLVIMPQALIYPWEPKTLDELASSHLEALLAYNPEMVLLGTGSRQRFPHPRITYALMAQGIGVEVMDTRAACRTYNIVVTEGRAVAAALMLA